MFRYDGQSGGETPGPFPNPEVKSARVSVCTVLRKRTGTQTRCQPLSQALPGILPFTSFSLALLGIRSSIRATSDLWTCDMRNSALSMPDSHAMPSRRLVNRRMRSTLACARSEDMMPPTACQRHATEQRSLKTENVPRGEAGK